jgi:hypothetical protein
LSPTELFFPVFDECCEASSFRRAVFECKVLQGWVFFISFSHGPSALHGSTDGCVCKGQLFTEAGAKSSLVNVSELVVFHGIHRAW